MKEFICKDLGHNCNKTLKARTEERLLDLAAVHLRDMHGVTTIMPENLAKIKNVFVNRTDSDAAEVVDRIFEKYNCTREPECTIRYIAQAELILIGGFSSNEHRLRAA